MISLEEIHLLSSLIIYTLLWLPGNRAAGTLGRVQLPTAWLRSPWAESRSQPTSIFVNNSRWCLWQGSRRMLHGLAAAMCPLKGMWSCCRELMSCPGDPPSGSEGLGGERSTAGCKNPLSNSHRSVSAV